jgi:hypothetical protein
MEAPLRNISLKGTMNFIRRRGMIYHEDMWNAAAKYNFAESRNRLWKFRLIAMVVRDYSEISRVVRRVRDSSLRSE